MIPIVAIAAGAAAMYFFDPEAGPRRRAQMRDKFGWLRDEFGDMPQTAEGKAQHLWNVTKNMIDPPRSGMPHSQDKHDTSGTADTTGTTGTTGTTDSMDSMSHMDTSSNVTDLQSKRAA